jgi:hypothetical protein
MSTSAPRAPLTLRDVVRRAAVTTTALVAITAAATGSVVALTHEWTLDLSSGSLPADTAIVPQDALNPAARSDARTAALVREHHCWSSAATVPPDMRGEIPGHVVVTTAGSAPHVVYSAGLVAAALDEVLRPGVFTPGRALVVHAFCR